MFRTSKSILGLLALIALIFLPPLSPAERPSPTASPTLAPGRLAALSPVIVSVTADRSRIIVRHSDFTIPADQSNEVGFWYRRIAPTISSWTYLGVESWSSGEDTTVKSWPAPEQGITYELAGRLRSQGRWTSDFFTTKWISPTSATPTPSPVPSAALIAGIGSVTANSDAITANHSGAVGSSSVQYIGFWYRQTIPTVGTWVYLGLTSFKEGEVSTSTPWPTKPTPGSTYQLAARLRLDREWSGDYTYGTFAVPGEVDPTPEVPFAFDKVSAEAKSIVVTHNGVITPPGSRNFLAFWYRSTAPTVGSWKYLGFVEYQSGDTQTEAPWISPDPVAGVNYQMAARRWTGSWAGGFVYGTFEPLTPRAPVLDSITYDDSDSAIVGKFAEAGNVDSAVGFWARELSAFNETTPEMASALKGWIYLGTTTAGAEETEVRFKHSITTVPVEIAAAVRNPRGGWSEYFLNIAPEGSAPTGGDAYPRLHSAWIDLQSGDAGGYFDIVGDQPCHLEFYAQEVDPTTCTPLTTEVFLGSIPYVPFQRRISVEKFWSPPLNAEDLQYRVEFYVGETPGPRDLLGLVEFNVCDPVDAGIVTEVVSGVPGIGGTSFDMLVSVRNNRTGQMPGGYAFRILYPHNTVSFEGIAKAASALASPNDNSGLLDATLSYIDVFTSSSDSNMNPEPDLFVVTFDSDPEGNFPFDITLTNIPATPVVLRDTSNQPILTEFDFEKTLDLGDIAK